MIAPDPTELPLTLRLLGPFEAHANGVSLPRLRSRKGLGLFALLTLRAGRDVERNWIAGTLWPESTEALAAHSLRTCLSDLRRALGPEAVRLRLPTRHTLCLDLSGAFVDLLAFDVGIARGALASLEEAVALYRGPLLEGCGEEWVFPERQAREAAYLGALETLAALAKARGDAEGVERRLRRVITLDPMREAAQRELMHVLADGGNYAAAVQVYRDLRLHLHRETACEPDPETTTLFQQLRAEAREQAVAPPSGARRAVPALPGALTAAPGDPERADDFPVLPRLSAFPHNLPLQLTRFVGRERDLAAVKERLSSHRLVTLTGVGGTGKTRLALQVGADRLSSFADGVWLVELAPIRDPGLVLPAVAAVFGVHEEPGRPLLTTLTASVRTKNLLLIMDNFEQVLGAAPQVLDLLAGAPQVTVLATSRAPLHLRGEQEYAVPPLDVPDPQRMPPVEVLSHYAAVELFCQRARDLQPDFALAEGNAAAVGAICRRLDGLPLAIELAAGRINLLSPTALLSRLELRLPLLTGGSRDLPARQQALRATIAWSYDLLTAAEQALFRRLSVFAGGCTLEAAEAVCPFEGELQTAVLDGLAALVNQSLVKQEEQADGSPRFLMLETLREFGRESLSQSGETEIVRQRHRDYFLGMAEAGGRLNGRAIEQWLARLKKEHDNLRAAVDGCIERVDAEVGLRLGAALWQFWCLQPVYKPEGRDRLIALLSLPGAQARTRARGKALHGAGVMTSHLSDYRFGRALGEESLAIFRELGDPHDIADSLAALGPVTMWQGDYETARALHEESLAIFRELGDPHMIAHTLCSLGVIATYQGDYEAARAPIEESVATFRERGDPHMIAATLRALAAVLWNLGEYEAARESCEESLAIWRERGAQDHTAHAILGLGHVARAAGQYALCAEHYRESITLRLAGEDRLAIGQGLEDFAGLAGRQGQWERAVRLLGAAESVARAFEQSLPVANAKEYHRTVDGARVRLSEAEFAAAWAAGRALTLEAAVAYAREDAPPESTPKLPESRGASSGRAD